MTKVQVTAKKQMTKFGIIHIYFFLPEQNDQCDELRQFSHARLSIRLSIHELVSQLSKYRSEVLHTSFSPQRAAHLLEPPILEH